MVEKTKKKILAWSESHSGFRLVIDHILSWEVRFFWFPRLSVQKLDAMCILVCWYCMWDQLSRFSLLLILPIPSTAGRSRYRDSVELQDCCHQWSFSRMCISHQMCKSHGQVLWWNGRIRCIPRWSIQLWSRRAEVGERHTSKWKLGIQGAGFCERNLGCFIRQSPDLERVCLKYWRRKQPSN